MPIYPAGEKPLEGMDSERLFHGIKAHGHREAMLCHQRNDLIPLLLDLIHSGDVVLTLGAGDVHLVGSELLENL
jgi:UDP-N-acetylmuramate--alanine ligase